ncbi:hypothetical protein HMI55_001838 [Coelomomyces lativittatus]|nr:hypothetical protein HMI55_001838 [Coelomomyces lativittatus]
MPPSFLLKILQRKPSPQLHRAELKLYQPGNKIKKKKKKATHDPLSQHSSSNRLQKGADTRNQDVEAIDTSVNGRDEAENRSQTRKKFTIKTVHLSNDGSH